MHTLPVYSRRCLLILLRGFRALGGSLLLRRDTNQYNFESAVMQFGLGEGLCLDIRNLVSSKTPARCPFGVTALLSFFPVQTTRRAAAIEVQYG